MPEIETENKLTGIDSFDIRSEEWREYLYPEFSYKIISPVTLYVKKRAEGDSHRVVDAEGVTHYVPVGWKILRWKADPKVSF